MIDSLIEKYRKKFEFHKKYNPNNPGGIKAMRVCQEILKDLKELKKKDIYKHRCEVADEFIESRKENMCIDHYNDLKYIVNECGLESTW